MALTTPDLMSRTTGTTLAEGEVLALAAPAGIHMTSNREIHMTSNGKLRPSIHPALEEPQEL